MQKLKNDYDDEKSRSIIELSQKLQQATFTTYKLRRENIEFEEQYKYNQRQIEIKTKAIYKLEE